MKKKLMSLFLTIALTMTMMIGAVPITAAADTMMVVTIGADLTDAQKEMILNYFNIKGQSYQTITVTNQDEVNHLGHYMSRDIIGYRTISCALIRPMTYGGIQVKTANLTYVTSNMIASNLATAGVTNAEVLAAAPFKVSGTGALTGCLMAYENVAGVTLDQTKKDVASHEFATTYELGQTIGQQEAQQIVNDMKMQVINGTLQEDNSITNEQITEIVNNVVNNYTTNTTTNNGLTANDIAVLQQLAAEIAQQKYQQGTLDALAQIQKTLEGQTQKPSTDATTQIVDTANPTTDQAADTTDSTISAADAALSDDSILNDTDAAALAPASEDGTVPESSTAESTIDTTTGISSNVDTQIEIEQGTAVPEAAAPAQDSMITDPNQIPEATDSFVIGGDDQLTDGTGEIPQPDAITDGTGEIPQPADFTSENPVDPNAGIEGNSNGMSLRETPITTDDLNNGSAQLVSYNADNNTGSQALGSAPIAIVLPYDNLVPVTATLKVTDNSGAEVANLQYDSANSSDNIKAVGNDGTISVPGGWAGYTKVLVMPKDVNSGAAFQPAAGQSYSYTFNAHFAQTADPSVTEGVPTLDVDIINYTPYYGTASYGFALSDAKAVMPASTVNGSIIFPEDNGDIDYATVTSDQAGIMIGDGSVEGVSRANGESVQITPYGAGKVTLTINYFASAIDMANPACTVTCSIQFS